MYELVTIFFLFVCLFVCLFVVVVVVVRMEGRTSTKRDVGLYYHAYR